MESRMRSEPQGSGSGAWVRKLGLRAGDLVEVRSKEEVLATLDKQGCLEGMPFMPEMLRYCGKRFRVSKRAEKACDTIQSGRGRRLFDSVHLENLRCDGSAHGGCQALCQLWWREAWLKRVSTEGGSGSTHLSRPPKPTCTEDDLHRAARLRGFVSAEVYSCQATRLLHFTHGLRWWDPRPVIREIRCRNVSRSTALKVMLRAAGNMLRRRFRMRPVPSITGRCGSRTPSGRLPGLRPGDWVMVKTRQEIEGTLDRQQRNRGLFFDIEMLPFCGQRMRILQKVEQIIDEKTGVMRRLPNDCWILDGAFCHGYQSRNRLFCARAIHSYWREIWLKRPLENSTQESPPAPT